MKKKLYSLYVLYYEYFFVKIGFKKEIFQVLLNFLDSQHHVIFHDVARTIFHRSLDYNFGPSRRRYFSWYDHMSILAQFFTREFYVNLKQVR